MPRGTGRGSVTRHGRGWRARIHAPDGSRPSKTFGTKSAAEAWRTAQLALIDKGKWKPERVIQAEKFGVYAAAWVKNRRTGAGNPLRPRTRRDYERQLEHGLASFASTPISSITPAMVRKWHAERVAQITQAQRDAAEERGLDASEARYTGDTAAAREARLLRAVLNTAVEDDLIEKNPVPANLAKASTGVPHRIPTPDELARIVQHLPDEWRAVVLIAAFGGLRIGEWRALRRSDFTLNAATDNTEPYYIVSITRQAQHIPGDGWQVGPPKSTEGIRQVALPSHVTATITHHLDTYVGEFPGSLLVEPPNGGEFIHNSMFYKRWNAAKALAGVPGEVRGHDLRGFAGTMFAQGGATLRETMAFLGHATTQAAMTYQATTGRGAELANRMPALPSPEPSNITSLDKGVGQ